MATNLSDLGLPTEAELQALEKELDAQVNSLLGTPQESSVEADPSPIDFDNFFKPLDPNSEEYKDVANSTSNKWDIATDELGANFYSSLGVISAKFGLDDAAKSFRETATQYRKDAASKPKPDISMSITEEGGKIYDKFSEGEFLEALKDTAEFVHSALIGAAPSIAAVAPAVAAAPILASVAGVGATASSLVAIVAGLASGVTLSSGNIYEELIKNGVSKEEAENISLGAGAAIGSLERLGLAHVVKGLSGKLGKDLTIKYLTKNTNLSKELVEEAVNNAEDIAKKSIISETVKGGVKGSLVEGTTEASQAVIETLVPPIASGKDVEGGKLLKNVVDSFAVGSIAGSAIRGPLQGLSVPVARESIRQSEESTRLIEELDKASTELEENYEQGELFPIAELNKAQPITEQKQAVENQGELFEPDQLQTTEEQKIADQATLLEAEEPIITPPRPALTEAREQATGMQTSEDIDSLIRVREKLAALKAKDKKKFSKEDQSLLNRVDKELQIKSGNKSFNFMRTLVSRSTTPLRNLSNRTPTAKQMVNDLQNMPAKHNADVGKYYTLKEDIIQSVLKDFKLPFQSRIDKNLEKQVTDQLNYGDYIAPDPKARKVAEELRSKIYDPLYYILKASGVDINRVDNYLTRLYKFKTGPGRKKSIQGMVDILNKNGLDGATIVDNILSNDGVFIPDGDIDILLPDQESKQLYSSQIDPEKTRNIPTNVVKQLDLQGYLESDFDKITNKYIISSLKRANLKKYVDTYNPVINNLYKNGAMAKEEAVLIKDVVDAIQGKYTGGLKPMSEKLRRGYRFTNTSTYILTLPLAVITSLSEPLIVLHRVSPKNALYGLMDASLATFRQGIRTFLPKFTKSENERALMSLMQTADLALADAFRDIDETAVSKKVTDKFFRINLLAQFTQFSRNIALQAARRQTSEDIKLLQEFEYKGELVKTRKKGQKGELRMRPRETKETRRARERLALQGLRNPVPKVNPKTDQFEDITERQQQILDWANSPDLANPPDIITKGLGMVVDEVIMTPNAVNRPLWMSNPYLAPVALLKGFMTVFGNTVGMRFYKEVFQPLLKGRVPAGDIAKYAMTFTMLTGGILAAQALKNTVRYGKEDSPYDDLEGWEKIWSAILQSNIFGYGNVIVNALKSSEYGQDPVISILGPAAGKSSQVIKALASGSPKRIANAISANIPGLSALPAVSKEDINKQIEDLIKDVTGMAEGGSIAERLPNRRGSFVLPSIEDLRKKEMELVEGRNITVTPVEFAPVLPNVIPEVKDNSRIAPLPPEKPPVPKDNSRIAPLPPEKSEFARKEKETNILAFNKVLGYEGSSTKRYLDTNLDPTIGIGHLIKSDTIKKLMSIGYSKEDAKKIKLGKKEMTKEKVNELFQKELPTYIKSTRRLIKNYDSLSSNLRSELIQLNYRGDLKQGKKTRKLINAGKFKEAAKELLKHKEYNDLKSKGTSNSITDRLEAARDALLAEGTK
jgi:GH24 family phage-related lysozyme (muramidase)